jgi:primosomal protein N' (replication factor Y)
MYYYSILLQQPTKLKETVYCSQEQVSLGARVIVSLNNKPITGICDKEIAANLLSSNIKYKSIIEILDDKSIISSTLRLLAEWISKYYRCPSGKAVFAMLPSIIMPEIASQIKWLSSECEHKELEFLYALLSDGCYHKAEDVRKHTELKPFYKAVEKAEELGLLEVTRAYTDKIKPKTSNYIVLNEYLDPIGLTNKQTLAMQRLQALGHEIPMQSIANEITYSIIKALVSKGLIKIVPRKIESRAVIYPESQNQRDIELTPEQKSIILSITNQYEAPKVHLLYGITGSGKTEVYIEAIKFYLKLGKNIIMLIPEIALTPQMADRFYSAFQSDIAILHSQLSERQRYEQWKQIKNGKCRIVIGARSAIFAPLEKIGLIIVDEEHEPSYKQENAPRYNGRDVAIVRAKMESAAIILGSATPSLESWNNVATNKYCLHKLSSRPTPQGLPDVKLIDLRDEEETDLLSSTLRDAIQHCLENKEQVILLQNRRGFASFVQCKSCGLLQQCPNCEISLYYHHDKDEMMCHYCGYHVPIPRKCTCGSYTFSFGAPGTQKIEQLLKIYYPTARILRMDSDSSHKKDAYSYMYEKMHSQDIDILLGTQMISKGLDFPNVTLVGVVLADISLNVPDFRASERTFNLLTQVAGRSGRGEKPGKVIIQTWNPEHYAIKYACQQNFTGFADEEMQYRQRLCYPPFYRLGRFIFSSIDELKLKNFLNKHHNAIEKLSLRYDAKNLMILGPVPAPMSKINKLYRYHLIIKAIDSASLSKAVMELESLIKLPSYITLTIDIDPLTLM